MYFEINNLKKNNLENFGNDNIEHLSNTDEEKVIEIIKREYNHDIEAIRNLGAISKSLITGKNYHNTNVELGEITYKLYNNKLCKHSVNTQNFTQSYSTLNEAKEACSSDSTCKGFTKTADQNFILHGAIDSTEIGMSFNCYQKEFKSSLNNNNLIIPANMDVKGNIEVKGTFNLLPEGCIIIWSKVDIPPGWVICDGNNDTPDLRGRFVLGSGQGTGLTNRTLDDVGPENGNGVERGGEEYKLNNVQLPTHSHDLKDGAGNQHAALSDGNLRANHSVGRYGSQGPNESPTKDSAIYYTSPQGGGKAHNNMPPYYVLIYIMKVY